MMTASHVPVALVGTRPGASVEGRNSGTQMLTLPQTIAAETTISKPVEFLVGGA